MPRYPISSVNESREGTFMLPRPSAVETKAPERSHDEIVSLIPALRAFARSFCREPSEADDLVQETLAKGIAKIEQFQPGTSMKSWLFTIMRNTFYTRARVSNREAPGLLDCASSQPTMQATQEWSVQAREMAAALLQLPEDQREIIVLIGMLGVSYDEAAAITGCAIGTVKSRLSRARARLSETLGGFEPSSRPSA